MQMIAVMIAIPLPHHGFVAAVLAFYKAIGKARSELALNIFIALSRLRGIHLADPSNSFYLCMHAA